MMLNSGRVRRVALLLLVASMFILPVAAFAQHDIENPDPNPGGSGAGGCDYNACTQDYCGCPITQWNGEQVLTGWSCTCSTHYCAKTCNYSPRQ